MLSNYRVLDLTDEKGLICGKILADLGADVIKVESPGGDSSRNIGPFYKGMPDPEKSLLWFSYNTNKRSITLNVETETGKDIFRELTNRADVIIESFTIGYLERLGLDYLALSKTNSSLIVTSITPFGAEGPYTNYKATDMVAAAMGGWMYLCGEVDRPPVVIGFPQSYLCAGIDAAIGTVLALYERENSGQGQHVTVSAQQSVCMDTREAIPYWVLTHILETRTGPFRVGLFKPGIRQQNTWPCKDGYIFWYMLGGLAGAQGNQALVDWMDSEGMAGDLLKQIDWLGLDMQKIEMDFIEQIQSEVGKFFQNHTKQELYEGALERQIILYPVSEARDLLENIQLKARGFWTKVQYPELGVEITHPGAFIKSSEYSITIRHRAPLVGEHNEEIYTTELGIPKADLQLFKQSNII